MDCIFCQIVGGQAASHRVYEDDEVLAFLDLFPVSPGHVLVIPKVHAVDILDLPEASAEAVARVSRRLAHAIDEALQPDGLHVEQRNGAAAGQTVYQYHMHLIPRSKGVRPGRHGAVPSDPDAMAEIASLIVGALKH